MKKRLIYQVCVGKPSNLYKHCIASVSDYCERHDIEHHVQTKPKLWIKPDPFLSNRSKECQARPLPLPIFEKENAFNFLPDYDQVAIVDADIYARSSAPNIFDEFHTDAFGGCVERDMPINEAYRAKILNYSQMQYSSLKDVDWKWNKRTGGEFMNMGLMLMDQSFLEYLDGDSPEEFIKRRQHKRFVDGMGPWKWSTDQTMLNWFIRKRKVPYQKMSWKWNALYTALKPGMIDEAHFVHFFLKDKLPNRGENVNALMKDIGE
jgi:hypothetical protein